MQQHDIIFIYNDYRFIDAIVDLSYEREGEV